MISSQIFSGEDIEISSRIEQNYVELQQTISTAAHSIGKKADEILVVAVSKTVGIAEVEKAIQAGIHDFGENRSQVFTEKQSIYPLENWHFIGSIQTNKLKNIVGRACLIHSVASEHALEVINKRALGQQTRQAVLIEVNTSGEASKDGVTKEKVAPLLELASQLPGVEVKGLMTMAAIQHSEHEGTARQSFASLRELRDNLVPIFADVENISLNELSMGMSDDYVDAIYEGATIVRIGRRLWS